MANLYSTLSRKQSRDATMQQQLYSDTFIQPISYCINLWLYSKAAAAIQTLMVCSRTTGLESRKPLTMFGKIWSFTTDGLRCSTNTSIYHTNNAPQF